jgi:hypothetical protein
MATPVNVALALKDPPPYYEADATAYARAIGNALATISHALPPRAPAVPAGGAPASSELASSAAAVPRRGISTLGILAVLGIAGGVVWWATRAPKKQPREIVVLEAGSVVG